MIFAVIGKRPGGSLRELPEVALYTGQRHGPAVAGIPYEVAHEVAQQRAGQGRRGKGNGLLTI